MSSATSPNQEGVAGTDSRSGLDEHRRISDTGHIYLLVENNFVLPHQGGIFLSRLATGYISLRNSWDAQATCWQEVVGHLVPQALEQRPGRLLWLQGEVQRDHLGQFKESFGKTKAIGVQLCLHRGFRQQ